jgi:predicted Zn-dependent protease
MKNAKLFFLGIGVIALLSQCGSANGRGSSFNLFTIEQDRELGLQVSQEIDNNPAEYPVLDSGQNTQIYQYLYDIRNRILNSGKVKHKDDFAWRLRIIQDDQTKNAFCTPGGYIYVYTGLMKYLDTETQLAGVLAHEIGHADLRHSTVQMTKLYGVQTLIGILAGDRENLAQLTTSIIGLRFSRGHETEADQASVTYLCPTDYDAAGGAQFFEKIEAEGGASMPEFLSTHPNPENRIESFYTEKQVQNCTGAQTFQSRYENMMRLLP